jgi:hypothetical protein
VILHIKGHLSSNKGKKMLQFAKTVSFSFKPISYSQDQTFLLLGNWLSQQHHAHVDTWLFKRWVVENKGFWNHGIYSRRGKGTCDKCGKRLDMHPWTTIPNANIVASHYFQAAFVVVDSLTCKTTTTSTLTNTTLHHTPLCKVGGLVDLEQTFRR